MMSLVVVLFLSVILLFVHIFTQGILKTRDLGMKWNMGTRDGENKPRSVLAGRAARALTNYSETYPAFLALVFLASSFGSMLSTVGVWIWFLGRLVYLPAYLSGIPYLRSASWLAAFSGLLLMAIAVFPSMMLMAISIFS